MNTPKWIPKQHNDVKKLFEQSRQLERDLRVLGKKFATDINLDLPDYYEFEQLLGQSKHSFELSVQIQHRLMRLAAKSSDKNIERSSFKVMQTRKSYLIRQNLKRRHYQLMLIINKMIKLMFSVCIHSDIVIDGALLLCCLYNNSVILSLQSLPNTSCGAQICSNTFPTLLSQPKKIDVSLILQTISKQRSEQCCLLLISCLLTTCKTELSSNCDSESSSIEILKALTTHLTPTSPINRLMINTPTSISNLRTKSAPGKDTGIHLLNVHRPEIMSDSETNDPTMKFFDNIAVASDFSSMMPSSLNDQQKDLDGNELLEQLILDEENYIASILYKCVKLCPSSFEDKLNKNELIKWVNRGSRGLWTQVGGTLEHVVLWWSNAPLGCRPSTCAKYLRDWLLIIQPEDAPEPILSTLKGLGESLTVHVTATTWDRQFRLALVASSLPVDYPFDNLEFNYTVNMEKGTTPGRIWSELLYTLTTFANSCDQYGTIPNELPIVEQIPVLHRLDHSVHTMRLWASAKAKSLCSEWTMNIFFRVVHDDVGLCLDQLHELRVPVLASADPLEVHIQVCVALRAKLVSEIKTNINKLKQTHIQCNEVLASICRTMCLATLSLCFPAAKLWQTDLMQTKANEYVEYFLNEIYLPVLDATRDIDILRLVLKIICEAWLDHIYSKKIKFSRVGALNLLKDFDGVAEWIINCSSVAPEHSEILSKHEVLRMCEGVGRILLRKPEEVISMLPSPHMLRNTIENGEQDEKPPLPPEMFVPNQQRWLELRARNRRTINCLCLSIPPEDY